MITIRIMWTRREEQEEAMKVLRIVEEALQDNGYAISVSRVFANRRNSGGRVYVTVKVNEGG